MPELVKAHGTPRLGNYRDPVREIFYMLLSARTTDSQYRKTFETLTIRFLKLTDIARARTKDIMD
jgi:endonuclease III